MKLCNKWLTIALSAVLSVASSACDAATPATQPVIASLPVELTARQRSTTVVPGTEGRLKLTIDDVTANQVMVSLATDTGEVVTASYSMSTNDEVLFNFGGASYFLILKQLDNALVGEDFGTFVVSDRTAFVFTEKMKIERLLRAVRDLADAKFLRDGAVYDVSKAASHLELKWLADEDQIMDARHFIDAIASKSTLTGEPYKFRLSDGSVVTSNEFLHKRLEEIEEKEKLRKPVEAPLKPSLPPRRHGHGG